MAVDPAAAPAILDVYSQAVTCMLTNAQVVERWDEVRVALQDGRGERVDLTIVPTDGA